MDKRIKLLLIGLVFVTILPIYYTYAEVSEMNTDIPGLTAILYDTNEYSLESGTALTEEGVAIENWEYNTSKFLQINPFVPADENTYRIKVELPPELYLLTDEIIVPSGYTSAEFTKNDPIIVNGTSTYSLKEYSGTILYTMGNLQTNGTIQLEIRYDNVLWDKQSNSSLTYDDVLPIKISLEKVDASSNVTIEKSISVGKITTGSKMPLTASSTFTTDAGDIHSSTYTAKLTETITQKISLGSSISVASYFENLIIEYNYPFYTDSNGNIYYLEFDENNFNLASFAKSTAIITKEEGKLTIKIPKAYINAVSSINLLTADYIDVSSILENLDGDSFTFKSGKAIISADGKNKSLNQTLTSVGIANITFDKNLVENVVLTTTSKSISIIERPSNAVSQIGGFYLENKGTGDSSAKTIFQEYDINNTGLLKVTTINVFADNIQEYIDIEYTLVDDAGEPVYLNESGERVSSQADGAINSWVYSLKNSYYNKTTKSNLTNKLYRGLLPETHQQYYFKSIKFTLSTIKAGAKLYAQSANSNITAAGNIYAYVSENAVSGDKVYSKTTVTSADETIQTLSKQITSTLSSTSQTSYMIGSASMSSSSIKAGESLTLSAKVQEISYPYGNSTWLKAITVGLVLPNGVSVNEQAITAKFSNKTAITGIAVETPIDIGNGNYLWKIKFPSNVSIGYPTESLKGFTNSSISNEAITFTLQLDTAATMNTTTLFAADMIFVAGYNQINAASGSYSYASKIDTYDLNENGLTTDKIGGINANSTVSCQIAPGQSTLDVSSNVTVTNNGVISEESDNQAVLTPDDTITYNLDIACTSGGQVNDFEYFLPIPKMTNLVDGFLIKGTDEERFNLSLQNPANLSGVDIFKIEYAFDTGLNYEGAKQIEKWYTADQITTNGLKWNDVTMLRLTADGVINNGDTSRISINLKYDGSTYAEEAGKETTWSSGGYFYYLNNGREVAGNFDTNPIAIKLNYTLSLADIKLTASEGMVPQIIGHVNEMEVIDQIPEFIKEQTFVIKEVETYNVNLQTKDYIIENTDMASIEANQTFGITVSMNNGVDYNIIPSNQTTIGTNNALASPTLKFRLYNADSLSENIQNRYIIVKLESDNGVTLIQKIIINRELKKADEVLASIVAGNFYTTLSEVATSVTITQDSAFTAQLAVDYIPELFSEQKLVFSESLPVNTTITLVSVKNAANPTYWYYLVSAENVNEISLTNFKQMGTTAGNSYLLTEGSEISSEQFLIIVDFERCSTELNEGDYNLKLVFEGIDVEDLNSTVLSFSTKTKRNFTISTDLANVDFGNEFKVSYTLSEVQGTEVNYAGKKLALVMKTIDLPLDSYLTNGTNKYYLNPQNEFIVPLGDVQNGSGEISLKLISNMLLNEEKNYLIDIELWVSATASAILPKFGEAMATCNLTITNQKKILPSLKITGMSERVIEIEHLQQENILTYEYIECSNCKTTIELHQKIGSGYQKLTNALTQVNGITTHTMGVFEIEPTNGSNEVSFRLSSIMQSGTYRMIIRVSDEFDSQLIEVPYNFIIAKQTQ